MIQCALLVAPYVQTRDEKGGFRSAWPGFGSEGTHRDSLIPCGYRSQTPEQHLAHLVVTHQVPLAQAWLLPGGQPEEAP